MCLKWFFREFVCSFRPGQGETVQELAILIRCTVFLLPLAVWLDFCSIYSRFSVVLYFVFCAPFFVTDQCSWIVVLGVLEVSQRYSSKGLLGSLHLSRNFAAFSWASVAYRLLLIASVI